ncbi:hypothetical protein Chor_007425 [Crotalus horridus]
MFSAVSTLSYAENCRSFELEGPSIVTPPKDIWNVSGAQVYLSCEVIGIPTPILTWNKVTVRKKERTIHHINGSFKTIPSTNAKGLEYSIMIHELRVELLPGDRDNLAVQTRGGPEKHEVTGWVLISPLSKDDAGEYECHASNSKGEATASGKITVVNSLNEIPGKGESTEL